MKLTEAGRAQKTQIRNDLVHAALRDLWAEKTLTMANTPISLVYSRLATSVKRTRRGELITYMLTVPEVNRTYRHTVSVESEYKVEFPPYLGSLEEELANERFLDAEPEEER